MILLDAHAWLWWLASPDELSRAAADAVDRAVDEGSLAVSSISVWETAMLVKTGRLQLRLAVADLVAHCEALPFLRFVPLTPVVAVASVELEPFHADPADRIIVATAVHHAASLVTKDDRIRAFLGARAVW